MKVKRITYAGKQDVYNMEVKDTHNYVVNGGIVAHNCYDECRYFFMSRPIVVKDPVIVPRKVYDPLDD